MLSKVGVCIMPPAWLGSPRPISSAKIRTMFGAFEAKAEKEDRIVRIAKDNKFFTSWQIEVRTKEEPETLFGFGKSVTEDDFADK